MRVAFIQGQQLFKEIWYMVDKFCMCAYLSFHKRFTKACTINIENQMTYMATDNLSSFHNITGAIVAPQCMSQSVSASPGYLFPCLMIK
jgi:hypothetical protein